MNCFPKIILRAALGYLVARKDYSAHFLAALEAARKVSKKPIANDNAKP